jgi:acetyltransferase-like isoleucine patch superfamily enzyme
MASLVKILKRVVKSVRRRLHISYYIILFSKNWINPFLTFYINFAFLPLRQAIKFPIWIYSKTKFLDLKGIFIIDTDKIYNGMITIGKTNDAAASGEGTEILNGFKIIFKGKARIGCGCRILVFSKGELIIGDNFIMNNQNIIVCCNHLEIGNTVIMGHQNQISDTNSHYMYDFKNKTAKNNNDPIFIGNYCWIGNRISIMKGTTIPDYTIVGSNSLLNKKYIIPEGTVLAGIPAKEIASGYAPIWNWAVERKLSEYFKLSQSSESVYQFPEDTKLENIVNFTPDI